VYHVDADRFITEAHVKAIALEGATRILFKTRNSELLKRREFDPDFVAFSVGASRTPTSKSPCIGRSWTTVWWSSKASTCRRSRRGRPP
jgi:hypothetical protein